MTYPEPTPDDQPLESLPASPTRPPNAPPAPPAPSRPNLWSVLKHFIGKDLTRIALPVTFNEPLSFLQRLTEDLEYTHLLDRAATLPPFSPDRLALVAAFMVSHYASTAHRVAKPFNPLLHETFDLVDHARSLAVVAEQVSHHPPTSALHAQGRGWRYDVAHEIRNRFHPNALEVWPEGAAHVRFVDGDHYVYEQAHTYVHNIILGELWLDNAGTVRIREAVRGLYAASVKFRRSGSIFGDSFTPGDLDGRVTAGKKTVRKITGNWNTEVRVDGEVVWQAEARPGKPHTAGYDMPAWAYRLNALPSAEDAASLPKTDSRFRPDQRALERGMVKEASVEKERLEDAQRMRRKGDSQNGPMWFTEILEGSTGKKEWRYNGGYFKCKLTGFPDDMPDLF